MNRKEFARRVTATLRDSNIQKLVRNQKHVFHISDDYGHSRDFTMRKEDLQVPFTNDDIESFIDAALYVIKEALKCGDNISIHGFGTLGLQFRKGRTVVHPATGEVADIRAGYFPKFNSGNDLRVCAKFFELSKSEHLPEPEPFEELLDEDGEDDGN